MSESHPDCLAAPKLPNEGERLQALYRYHILDTPRELAFDDITVLAAQICQAPVAVVNLIDADRQWFKSEVGLGVSQTPLDYSICAHALLEAEFLLVEDTLLDTRFQRNPLCVSAPHLRFYAGALLKTPDGLPLGTLCVLDRKPRSLEPAQQRALVTLARQVTHLLELHLLNHHQAEHIRERAAVEVELEAARTQALEASRAKSEFLTSMSHELRTPLNAIIGYAELLQENAEDHEPQELRSDLAKIQGAGRHLLGLVDNVLDLAKIEACRMEVYPEDVNLRKLLQEVHSTLGGVARKGGNTIVIDTTQAPPSFRTDRQKLGQVLLNLVGNACKFTENGQILLRVAPGEQGNLRLEVADTGIGIAPEGQEKLFLPFTQVPGVQSAFSRGTGLGLPISRKLCQLLGGDLYVESEPGKGSTFIVHLPDLDHAADEASANKTTSACVG